MIRQINSMRGRFETYKSYADVTFEESFMPSELEDALVLKVECTETSYFENLGGGNFLRKSLPTQAQFAPVYSMLTEDFNNDGFIDVLMAGNSYATETSTGRYDAMRGFLMTGKGNGNFDIFPADATGLGADKDVKALVEVNLKKGNSMLLVGNNNDHLESYTINSRNTRTIIPGPSDVYAIVRLKNGRSYKQEFYFGNNYLSQTSRKIAWNNNIESIDIYDNKNHVVNKLK